jgi:hypothetical protein
MRATTHAAPEGWQRRFEPALAGLDAVLRGSRFDASMARAKKATLQALDSWLDYVRNLGIEGLVEKKNGAFYQRRIGILHFHEDEDGVYADVKLDGDWKRVPINDPEGKQQVIRLLMRGYVARPAAT